MEGAALAAERAYDLSVAQAWHAAKFATLSDAGKLKGLSSYLGKRRGKNPLSAALAFFHQMKASGFPVKITRVDRSSAPLRPQTRPQ